MGFSLGIGLVHSIVSNCCCCTYSVYYNDIVIQQARVSDYTIRVENMAVLGLRACSVVIAGAPRSQEHQLKPMYYIVITWVGE